MADNANDEGTHCFPSIRRLAHETGYSPRTIMRIIQNLEAKKIVITLAKGNQHAPSQYLIEPSKGEKLPKFEPSRWARKPESDKMSPSSTGEVNVTSETVNVTNTTSECDTACAHNRHRTIIEPSLEPSEEKVTQLTPMGDTSESTVGQKQPTEPPAETIPAKEVTFNGKTYDLTTYQGNVDYRNAKAEQKRNEAKKKHTLPRAQNRIEAQQEKPLEKSQ